MNEICRVIALEVGLNEPLVVRKGVTLVLGLEGEGVVFEWL